MKLQELLKDTALCSFPWTKNFVYLITGFGLS